MHTSSSVTLAVAVFLASAVESVEALTIIVAAGVSRGWRSALEGAAAALAVLVVLVGALGPALVYLVPIRRPADRRRGALARLRAPVAPQSHPAHRRPEGQTRRGRHLPGTGRGLDGGCKRGSAPWRRRAGGDGTPGGRQRSSRPKRDATGFAVAFKGTFLEGLEIAIIVLGLGAGNHQLALAAVAALARHRGGGHHRASSSPASWPACPKTR